MEYDNDRPVKKMYRVEIWYWLLVGFGASLIDSLLLFYNDGRMWFILIMVNLLLLPVYIFYSEFVVSRFLFQGRNKAFLFFSYVIFLGLHALVLGIYTIISGFRLSPYEAGYFHYSLPTAVRESVWFIVNMSLGAGVFLIKKAFDEKVVVESLDRENTALKLKYLRSQLNPHFLFNTLNSIYSLSLQKSDKAPEVVVKLADLLRYITYESHREKVSLQREVEFIQNYIEIEKVRHEVDIRFTIEGRTGGIMLEPLLFIPFIENAFKHALDNTITRPFIYINLKTDEDSIALSIINNTNIDLETQAKRLLGNSIRNSKRMLEILYPESHSLDIIQTDLEELRRSELRIKHARERLENLYPDSHTLDGTSGRLTPAALTRINTSFSPGTGTGRSSKRRTSAGPGIVMTIAFIRWLWR